MPIKSTIQKAHRTRGEGMQPSTQPGEFVKAEVEKVRRGEHGVRNTRQADAIGLSEIRRAGLKLKSPDERLSKEALRTQAVGVLPKADKIGREGHYSLPGKSVNRSRSAQAPKVLKR